MIKRIICQLVVVFLMSLTLFSTASAETTIGDLTTQFEEGITSLGDQFEEELFEVIDESTDKAVLPDGKNIYRIYNAPRAIYEDTDGKKKVRPDGWSIFQDQVKAKLEKIAAGYSFEVPLETAGFTVKAGQLQIGTKKINPVSVEPELSKTETDQTVTLYKNIYPEIDVKFVDNTYERARTIIFNAKPSTLKLKTTDKLIFWEEYTLPAGTIVETDQGKSLKATQTVKNTSLVFKFPNSEEVFGISAPQVFDSAGINGEILDMEQTVEYNAKNGTLRIGVILPASFLLNKNRVYPVTVDPNYAICSNGGTGCLIDLYLKDTTRVDSNEMYVGYDNASGVSPCSPAGHAARHGVVKFNNWPSFGANETITSGYLRLFAATDVVNCGEYNSGVSIAPKRINTSWSASTVAYSTVRSNLTLAGTAKDMNASSTLNDPNSYSNCTSYNATNKLCSWQLTNSVMQAWSNGTVVNNGILLEPTENWPSGANPPSSWTSKQRLFRFRTANFGSTYTPYVEIVTQVTQPDLVVQSGSISVSDTTVDPSQSITVGGTVLNQGTASAGVRSYLGYYLSSDSTCTTADTFLAQSDAGILTAGATSAESANVTLPNNITRGATYYMCFIADNTSVVAESSETNNTRSIALTVNNLTAQPDLIVNNITATPTQTNPGLDISVTADVVNQGVGSTGATSRLGYYLSTNTSWSQTSDIYLGDDSVSTLGAGSTGSENQILTIPSNTAAGAYYILFVADYESVITESSESNNIGNIQISILDKADIIVESGSLSESTVVPGQAINAYITVKNIGGDALQSGSVGYYFSTNNSYDTSDTRLRTDGFGVLDRNQTSSENETLTIPNVAPGNYYIIFYGDYDNSIYESNESNNYGTILIRVQNQGQSDSDSDGYTYAEEQTAGTNVQVAGGGNGGQLYGQFQTYAVTQQDKVTKNEEGDPVNTRTGGFDLTHTDFVLPGRGEAIQFSRTYNSKQIEKNSRFGQGWDFSYNMYYYKDPATQDVQVYMGGGMVGGFDTTDNGATYTPFKGQYDQLVKRQDGDLEYRTLDGVKYVFSQDLSDNMGLLKDIIDPNGNTTTLSYTITNDVPLLTRVTDPAGRYILLSYGSDNLWDKVVQVQERASSNNRVTITYTYNAQNQLTMARQSRYYNGQTEYVERRYGYDANGLMTTYTDPRGTVLTNTYDSEERVTVQHEYNARVDQAQPGRKIYDFTYSGSYNGAPGSVACTVVKNYRNNTDFYQTRSCFNSDNFKIYEEDGSGNIQRWSYDSSKGTISSYTDQRGNVTQYSFDSRRRKVSEILTNINGYQTTTTYAYENNFNRLTAQTETMVKDGQTVARTTTYDVNSTNGNVNWIQDANNKKEYFVYDQYGNVTRYTDKRGTIENSTYDANGNYQLTSSILVTDADGTETDVRKTYSYDVYGNRLTFRDPKNFTYTYEYDNHGNLRKQINPDATQKTYIYDLENHLISETDERGNITEYVYDTNIEASLLSTTYVNPDGEDITESYEYDYVGNKTKMVDGNGNETTYSYDNANRLTQVVSPVDTMNYTYDAAGNITRETHTNGNKTEFVYDARNNLTETKQYKTSTDFISTKQEFDGFNRVIATIDGKNQRTSYTYDLLDRQLTMTDPANNTTTYAYDNNNNQLTVLMPRAAANSALRNSEGVTMSYEYDALNREIRSRNAQNKVTLTYYDANSNVVKVIDRQDSNGGNATRVAQFTYDNRNRQLKQIDAYGGEMVMTYDGVGNKITEKDAANRTTTFAYDVFDRLISKTEPGNNVTGYKYDKNSNITEITYPDNTKTVNTYDAGNRLTAVKDADNNTSRITFDSVGNILTETDKRNKVTTFVYDGLNRLTRETNANNTQTTYTYDNNSNKTEQNVSGKVTSFSYDNLDRVTQIANPGNKLESFTYDAEGNVLTYTDGQNQVQTYTYDALNRQVSKQLHSGVTISYSYDNWDNLRTTDDSAIDTVYTFDNKNRLLTETRTFADFSAAPYTVSNSYYADDRLNTQTDAAGRVFTHTYDNRGFLDTVEYDDTTIANYNYTPYGRQSEITYGNGVKSNYSYDAIQRPTGINIENSSNELLFKQEYGYDAESNLTSLTEGLTEETERTVTFGYDNLEQITSVVYPEGNLSFSYDAWGNRTNLTTLAETVSYNYAANSDELLSATYDSNLTVNYAYDNNGSLLSEVYSKLGKTTKTVNYQWNTENELQTTTYQKGARPSYIPSLVEQAVDFTYDDAGNRIKKSSSKGTTYYLNNGVRVLNELNETGAVQKSLVYGLDQIAEVTEDGDLRYIHTDRLGSTVLVTDEQEEVLEKYEYDVYGSLLGSGFDKASGKTTNYLFTNQEFDPETELYYYNARYYNPKIGRFISRDTVIDDGGTTLGKNRYIYVQNNPLKYTDPTGEFTVEEKNLLDSYKVFNKILNKLVDENTYSLFVGPIWNLKEIKRLDFGGLINDFGAYTLAQYGVSKIADIPLNKMDSINKDLETRYIYTEKAGLIDMRHFFQMAYLSWTFTNDLSTSQGYKHEEKAEKTSAFAPEDLVSNALGAYFGANKLSLDPQKFKSNIDEFLNKLDPVNSLSKKKYNEVINFYTERNKDGVPKNQNFTANPIYHDEMFPFKIKKNNISIDKEIVSASTSHLASGNPYLLKLNK